MGAAHLTIDLDAVAANWRALARRAPGATPGATVKADAYGLGAEPVARRLASEGARHFFIAQAEEGQALRRALGQGPAIYVFAGHMTGDTQRIRNLGLTPVVNSAEQLVRHLESLPGHPFALHLDTGMNRLGMGAAEWAVVRDAALAARPALILSHLACADEPDHPMNARQRRDFIAMTDGWDGPRSLAATGGVMLGAAYAFDLTRPGVGLYGGAPFDGGQPVLHLAAPVIQTRAIGPGETVGYNATWTAPRPTVAATVAAGYADGLLRSLTGRGVLWAGDTPCPILGRVSMDLIVADVTDLDAVPDALDILGPRQGIDDLARAAGTVGYEVLTSLSARYHRRYVGARG